jgi:elongation factor P
MASTPVINLRKGNAVRYNNDVCIVIEMAHKTPPNLRAFVQMSIRNLNTGKVYNLRLTPNDSMESVNVSREPYEFSYTDPAGYHFLHGETFEDVTVAEDLVADVKTYLVEGQIYTLVFTEGAFASIELPTTMEMDITEAPEGVKGDSANNVYKAAVTQTGLTVQVPLFIGPGDRITVKTEDGSYTGRVS